MACRRSHCQLRPSRSRRASRAVAESVDERLIVGFVPTGRDSDRLIVRLLRELWRSDVGNPELHRSQTLRAESLAVCADSDCAWRGRTLASHTQMLHVTLAQSNHVRPLIVGHTQNVTHPHALQALGIGTYASARSLDIALPERRTAWTACSSGLGTS